MPTPGSRDQRLHPRHPTRAAARFSYAGITLPCVVRDYCLNGLYLAFADTRALAPLLSQMSGAAAQVEIDQTGDTHQRILIVARVAHISASGLGLHVDRMPNGALNALQAAAQQIAEKFSALPQSVASELAVAMHQECNRLLHTFLNAALQDFFSEAPAKLVQASYEQASFIDRQKYVETSQLLPQQRPQLEKMFFDNMHHHLDRMRQPAAADGNETPDTGLSLIDDDEFQDWLNLSAAINEIELANALPLAEFERNFNLLLGITLLRERNPYAPELLCRSFQEAIQTFVFTSAERAILYRTFSHALSRNISTLYEQLNKVLAPLQPPTPPKRSRSEYKPAATPEAAAQTSDVDSQSEVTELLERPSTPQPRMPRTQPTDAAPAAENTEYTLDRILTSIKSAERPDRPAQITPLHGGTSGQSSDGWALDPTRPRPNPIVMAEWLRQANRQNPVLRNTDAAREAVIRALPEADLRQLLAALDAILPAQGLPQEETEIAALSGQLQDWLGTSSGKPMRIGPAYRQNLDMTASLIRRAREEHDASSEVEMLIRRLERPLLKLALEEPEFLVTATHPARKVVNLLDQFTIAADNKGKFFDPKLQRVLLQMVDRICSQADVDKEIYDKVSGSLSKMLIPIRQARHARIARMQESYEARASIRQARARVSNALDNLFAERDVPEILLRLLDGGWRQYLTLLEMREGMQSEAWNLGLAVLTRIAGWFDHAPVLNQAAEVLPLLNLIESTLAGVNVDSAQLAALMDEIAATLQHTSDASVTRVRFQPSRTLAAAQIAPDAAALEPLVDQLRVGEWWELLQEGNWVPMQIIWISQPASHCALCNRSATEKRELGLAEFVRQQEDGQARRGKNLEQPLLERSEFGLFDENYHGLLDQLHQDPVTGLDGRSSFLLKLSQSVAKSARKGLVHSLCIIEFDQFRLINNQHGPQAGNMLARKLADELHKLLRPNDMLSAFQEDTFALFLPNTSQADAMRFGEGILRQLGDFRFKHGEDNYSIGLNLGLAEYPPAVVSPMEAIKRADSACLAAKSLGRNRMQLFEPSNVQLQSQESLMELAGQIDALMENGGMYLRCQMVAPINTDSGLLPYYEILLGITGDNNKSVPPMQFIPAIENLQRSHEIDIWVVKKVFTWIRANRERFASIGGFSINLSALSLSNSKVLSYLLSELAVADLPTEKIIFEITETAAIENYHTAQEFIKQVSRYGCTFSLDDFGSGYSSYSHLRNLRTGSLKIDGSFVKEIAQNPADFAMVKSMNDIGHSLGMKTVAEYVESAEILSMLREIGVDYAQGFAIHEPSSIDHLSI